MFSAIMSNFVNLASKIDQQLVLVNVLGKCAQMKILTVRLSLEHRVWSRMTFCSVLWVFRCVLVPLVDFDIEKWNPH